MSEALSKNLVFSGLPEFFTIVLVLSSNTLSNRFRNFWRLKTRCFNNSIKLLWMIRLIFSDSTASFILSVAAVICVLTIPTSVSGLKSNVNRFDIDANGFCMA